MSRIPVHTVIEHLYNRGLVVKNPGKRPKMVPISFGECLKILEFRKAIEGEAAFLATKQLCYRYYLIKCTLCYSANTNNSFNQHLGIFNALKNRLSNLAKEETVYCKHDGLWEYTIYHTEISRVNPNV